VLGEDHPDTVISAGNLAADLRALGESDDTWNPVDHHEHREVNHYPRGPAPSCCRRSEPPVCWRVDFETVIRGSIPEASNESRGYRQPSTLLWTPVARFVAEPWTRAPRGTT
jgi:hypothetical protein